MKRRRLLWRIYRRFAFSLVGFIVVLAAGTAGYRIIGGPATSIIDALYMTFITVATIGYGEVVDLSHSPGGRIFTMAIATAGILNFTYLMSVLTAFIVEGDVNQALRRRRMQKGIDLLNNHYIVCGIGRVGYNVTHELIVTDRAHLVIDTDREKIDQHRERYPEALYIHGDASEDDVLTRAGVARAVGVFAITGDDSKNLVITITAKQLNPQARVVARCHEVNYFEKMKKVGADAIVSPDFTGGMRIASSMIRPQVVGFLDEMLRSDKGLRVEEIPLLEGFSGAVIGDLELRHKDYVLLAVRDGDRWLFNPKKDFALRPGNTLIVMATPQGRRALEEMLTRST